MFFMFRFSRKNSWFFFGGFRSFMAFYRCLFGYFLFLKIIVVRFEGRFFFGAEGRVSFVIVGGG